MENKHVPTFAEIEYDTSVQLTTDGEKVGAFPQSLVPPPQTIEYKPVDPIRQKFFDMRSLASDRPFARDDSELFFRQAKFMKDFTDDDQGEARFNMYFPYYQHMGYEQLRTYFTWRTKLRNGEKPRAHVSYIFLYVYELLSVIGVADSNEALEKLLMILDEYAENNPPLKKYLPRWIKDFFVYYDVSDDFKSFAKEHGIKNNYPELFLFEFDDDNIIEYWSTISNYDIADSKFYQDGNEELLSDYFRAVLVALNEHFSKQKKRIEDLVIYRTGNRAVWYPFKHALFFSRTTLNDRQVTLPGKEAYYCKNNRWTASLPIFYSNRESIAGYLVKKTESSLRELYKYKYKLKMSPRPFQHSTVRVKELDEVIEKAVADHHKFINRTIVNVDFENLERIRVEALDTQDKLIVEEEAVETYLSHQEEQNYAETDIRDETVSYSDDTTTDEWDDFKDALNEIELRALKIALEDGMSLKAFSDENGIMLEVLADNINEKSADIIGDSILEVNDGITIYDDYIENIKCIFK